MKERDLPQLTADQAVVLSIITGCVLIPFKYVLEDVSKRLNRKVDVNEFKNGKFIEELQELYRPDFLKLVLWEVKPELIIVGDVNH